MSFRGVTVTSPRAIVALPVRLDLEGPTLGGCPGHSGSTSRTRHITSLHLPYEKELVFREAADRRRFFTQLAATIACYGWNCRAYCLMGNSLPPASSTRRIPTCRAGCNTCAVSTRSGSTGSTRGEGTSSAAIRIDPHRDRLAPAPSARYVALNPVRAELCRTPRVRAVGKLPSAGWSGASTGLPRRGARARPVRRPSCKGAVHVQEVRRGRRPRGRVRTAASGPAPDLPPARVTNGKGLTPALWDQYRGATPETARV